jgi:hypothetical protein
MKRFKLRIVRDGSEKVECLTVRAETAEEAIDVAENTYCVTESGYEILDAKEVRSKKVVNA